MPNPTNNKLVDSKTIAAKRLQHNLDRALGK